MIEDNKENKEYSLERGRATLIFSLKNEVGGLIRALKIFQVSKPTTYPMGGPGVAARSGAAERAVRTTRMNRTPTPRNLRPSPPSVSAGRWEDGLGRLRPTLRLSAVPAAWVSRPWFQVSTVVELNVGGQVFTTTRDTLRKLPGSRLAEVFSDPATACKDAEGRFFIDRPGTYFQPILDYLRSGQVPMQHIREVYHEAQFYDIQPLVKLLEDTPEMFGEQVSRKQFLLQVPNYSEHLELLLRLARAEAVGRRESKVVVCVLCNEGQAARCAEPICFLESQKMSVVKFGPCNLGYDNDDLLRCLEIDIKAQGYWVSYQEYRFEKAIKAKLENCFYTFTFTWW
ncbi:BTB/POZ domain-containing protein KCTD14-like [Erethizon dorsatum]